MAHDEKSNFLLFRPEMVSLEPWRDVLLEILAIPAKTYKTVKANGHTVPL